MCGIVGYIGENASKFALEALKKLEYRGYDSSGIAYIENGKTHIFRRTGIIANLEKILPYTPKSTLAICRTRWATHGNPSEANSHPHTSGKWHLVHNGIVENYLTIKKSFFHNYTSNTDTEVAVSLIDYISNTENLNSLQCVMKACDQIVGSFAFAAFNDNEPNKLYLAKRKSPLYVAVNKNSAMVGSDVSIFTKDFNFYYSLENDEFAVVECEKVIFFNKKGEKIEKNPIKIDFLAENTEIGKFNHYMIKEINDIPNALKATYEYYTNSAKSILPKKVLKNINSLELVACGTAYHSALMGKEIIETKCNLPVNCHIASEFNNRPPILNNKQVYVFVSQSGETADTLEAMRTIKAAGLTTIALTNVRYSTLAKECDYVLPIFAGKEVAVASTKAYNCQVLALYILSDLIYNFKNDSKFKISLDIDKLIYYAKILINNNLEKEIAQKLKSKDKVFFIGRGADYVSACEASLKLKEISYINSSAFASGELKHGSLALVDENTYVFGIATEHKLFNKLENALNEVRARGGKTIIVGQKSSTTTNATFSIELPKMPKEFYYILSIIPMQKLAYYTAVNFGYNPDKPRNLAKSVTVE